MLGTQLSFVSGSLIFGDTLTLSKPGLFPNTHTKGDWKVGWGEGGKKSYLLYKTILYKSSLAVS